MIQVNNIAKHFGANGFDAVSFIAGRGQLTGLTGASGCGKSTLLNILTGMLKPDSLSKHWKDLPRRVFLMAAKPPYCFRLDTSDKTRKKAKASGKAKTCPLAFLSL